MPGHRPAVTCGQPDALSLHDQVAHRQHQAAGDAHAVTGALGAERAGGKGVMRHVGAQRHHAAQAGLEVEAVIRGARLEVCWDVAVGLGHRGKMRLRGRVAQGEGRQRKPAVRP